MSVLGAACEIWRFVHIILQEQIDDLNEQCEKYVATVQEKDEKIENLEAENKQLMEEFMEKEMQWKAEEDRLNAEVAELGLKTAEADAMLAEKVLFRRQL